MVKRVLRQYQTEPDCATIGEIGPSTDWSSALKNIEVVVHLAARVHVMGPQNEQSLFKYREINTESTLNLARHAVATGVRRLIYLSSIKVNGEATPIGKPFSRESQPTPTDPYGRSKLEAERGLLKIAEHSNLEVVIIRPPLVYGPEVKGNFLTIMTWLSKGWPLPLASVTNNQRSLVALDNLIDLIMVCLEHRSATNQIFLVSDGEDLSTTDLFKKLAHGMKQSPRLIPFPVWALKAGATLLGKRQVAERLFGSLQVDISKTESILGWSPPIGVDEGLIRAAKPLIKNRDN